MPLRLPSAACAGIAAFCVLAISSEQASAAENQPASRGEYLATIMDCGGCHTGGSFLGAPDPERYLAGSEVGFNLPGLGIFWPPNLTPHETGLAGWSEDDIIRAVRTGERPDGRMLAPAMPWHAYSALTDEDARALARYLKSLQPVDYKVVGPAGPDEAPPGPFLTVTIP